jgi:hypothetical protein
LDISEVLPIVGEVIVYIVAFTVSISGFYFALRVRKRWLRYSTIPLSAFLFAATSLSLWFDLYFIAGTTMHRPAIYSPDGKHVAVVNWIMSGAIGFDHVHVSVRSRYSPFAEEVFTGIAQAPPGDPEVTWTDSHHLLVSYWAKGPIRRCAPPPAQPRDIEVLCQE